MADPVYDREQEKQRSGLPPEDSPDFLRQREHLDNPDTKDNQPAGDPGDPRELKDQEDFTPASRHEQQVGRGYVEKAKDNLKGSGLSRRKKWLLAGIGGSIVALIIAFLFGFLGIFKLDHIMSNIDAKVFARMQGVEDRRSRRWMQAYLQMRLADIGDFKTGEFPNLDAGDKNDNLFFRSEKVRRGPLLDWYRTMRTSNFERDVFEKHGFKFVSVAEYDTATKQYKIRPGRIIMNGNTLTTLDISKVNWSKLEQGNTDTIRNYSNLVDLEKFDSDGEARRAIRKMVNEDIPAWRFFLRRHVRKDIQNQIGVRDWRFFEKTRDKLHEKKIEIRNKILSKAIPTNFKSGQILRCLFGVDNCRYSRDSADPVNRDSEIAKNGAGNQKTKKDQGAINDRPLDEFDTDVDEEGKPLLDKDKKPTLATRNADYNKISQQTAELAAKLGTKIGSSLNVFFATVNITGTLEILSQINKTIPQLAKMAIIAKGAQAMGLFQVFETSRDQGKSGELTMDEYGQLMQVMNTPTLSEGWDKVIEGNSGTPKNAKPTREEYCKDNYVPTEEDFHYLCDDKKIGDASNAEKIQKNYDASIGKIVGPFVDAYDGAKGVPLLGWVIKKTNSVLNFLGEAVGKVVMGLANAVGLGNDLKKVMTWVMGKVAAFIGAGPIMDGSEKAGEFTNWLIQGGAYTAESTARASGAAVTTNASKAASAVSLNEYRQGQEDSATLFSQSLSLSNPDSLASKSLFSLSNFKPSSFASLLTAPKNLLSSLVSPFTANAKAANTDNGYRAAEFAGLETYDFPPECYNLDPLAAEPLDGTNALDVFNNPRKYNLNIDPIGVTAEDRQLLDNWDTQTNSTEFYALIYKIIIAAGHEEGADDIAVKIYNCNLLDTRIRGSLGAIYGYTNDHGLEDGQVADTLTATGTPNQIPSELWEIFIMAAAKYNISPYALAAIYGYGEHCTFSGSCESSQITWDTSLIQDATSSAGAKGPFQFVDGTWKDYGDDCDGDGKKEVRNLKDSACGAANYLAASGARGIFDTSNVVKLKAAFKNYNHADWYANRVYDGYLELLAGIADSNTNITPVSGDVQQLAKQILSNPNVSYPLDAVSPNGSTKAVLQALANEQKAPVTCSNAGRSTTDINPNILKFLVELSSQTKVGVNALTDKCHSNGSPHYRGLSVDFECQAIAFDVVRADQIAGYYGGGRNGENCDKNQHWHYDF